MNPWRRLSNGLARVALGVLIVLPWLGLIGTAAGGPIFPVALVGLDPFVWACAGNSVAVAGGVAIGSMVIGVALARITTRWRFWGRVPLAAVACSAMVVPPACGAIGLGRWLERSGMTGLGPGSPTGWGGWLALVWLGLASGVPWVALRTGRVLARIEPAWEDIARSEGATRWRVWWTLLWPIARPASARAAATVFTLALVEPGVPWVLGLRRTLAFQITEAATSPQGATRAATLVFLAIVPAMLGRGLFRAWGRSSPMNLPERRVVRPRRAASARASVFAWLLGVWCLIAWLPTFGLVLAAAESPSNAWIGLVRDAEAVDCLGNSIVVGLAVGLATLGIALSLTARPKTVVDTLDGLRGLPPLAIGVGMLLVPVALLAIAARVESSDTGGPLTAIAALFDPITSPWVVLALALIAVRLPLVVRVASSTSRVPNAAWREVAWTLGATRRRAWWTIAAPRLWPARWRLLLLTTVLAATDSGAALVLAPTSANRTLGPGVVLRAAETGGLSGAAALAACLVAVNVAAFALSARTVARALDRTA